MAAEKGKVRFADAVAVREIEPVRAGGRGAGSLKPWDLRRRDMVDSAKVAVVSRRRRDPKGLFPGQELQMRRDCRDTHPAYVRDVSPFKKTCPLLESNQRPSSYKEDAIPLS